jgi:amino acid transporter
VSAHSEESPQFERQLTWKDGFAIALLVPVSIFASVGAAIGVIGAWSVAALFAIACTVGILQNFIFAELAGMFPNKAGGVALYAHEAWRRYLSPIGAITAFGYWAGWVFGVSVIALALGSVIHAEFFEGATWTIDTGPTEVGLGHLIGLLAIVAVSALNIVGIRPTVRVNQVLGAISVAFILMIVIGPFVTGEFDIDGLTWGLGAEGQDWGGWRLAIVFLFLFGWSSYGTEVVAMFTPEYRDPERDTARGLRAAGVVTLTASVLVPVGLSGTLTDGTIAEAPGAIYAEAFEQMVGPASGLVAIVLAAAYLMTMNGATADSGRALYGLANDDMTVKQLNHLNRHGVPGRAIAVGMIVNCGLLLFVGNILGIIFAANVGYVVAMIFALSGFVLLRRDRPDWPRLIRLRRGWIVVAAVLALYNLVLVVIGGLSPAEAGYGGLTEQLVGVGVLVLSLVLFAYRRIVQDRGPLRLREPVPEPPGEPRVGQKPVPVAAGDA